MIVHLLSRFVAAVAEAANTTKNLVKSYRYTD